jgi:hypothetical protein
VMERGRADPFDQSSLERETNSVAFKSALNILRGVPEALWLRNAPVHAA